MMMQPSQVVPPLRQASQIEPKMMQDAIQFCQASRVQTEEHYKQRVTEYMSTSKFIKMVRKTILKEDQEILHVSFQELRKSASELAKYVAENAIDAIIMFESELARVIKKMLDAKGGNKACPAKKKRYYVRFTGMDSPKSQSAQAQPLQNQDDPQFDRQIQSSPISQVQSPQIQPLQNQAQSSQVQR